MPSYGPAPLKFHREPPECSTLIAADGTATYRRTLMGPWMQCGNGRYYSWKEMAARIGESVDCWVITPEPTEGTDQE